MRYTPRTILGFGLSIGLMVSFTHTAISVDKALNASSFPQSASSVRKTRTWYTGFGFSFISTNVGGIAAFEAHQTRPDRNISILVTYDRNVVLQTLRDDGKDHDLLAIDGFYSGLAYIPPTRERFLLQYRDAATGELLGPYLVYKESHDDARKIIKRPSQGTFSAVDSTPDFLEVPDSSLTFPQVDLGQVGFYKQATQTRPAVLMAGFTPMGENQNGEHIYRCEAAVFHTEGLGYIRSVSLYSGDSKIVALKDDGGGKTTGDASSGDGVFSGIFKATPNTSAGAYLLTIVATDQRGRRSDRWPYVEPVRGASMTFPLRDYAMVLKEFRPVGEQGLLPLTEVVRSRWRQWLLPGVLSLVVFLAMTIVTARKLGGI